MINTSQTARPDFNFYWATTALFIAMSAVKVPLFAILLVHIVTDLVHA